MSRRLPSVRWLLTLACLCLLGANSLRADDTEAEKIRRVVASAMDQTRTTLHYDPDYTVLAYPGGDVPADRGVCTDVIIRSFRAARVDLQRLVHEDMQAHFALYPRLWGLPRPDPNIDHRRVPNLAVFFTRQGKSLPITQAPADYLPGDVVAWKLPGGLAHVGLVVAEASPTDPARRLMVHNIGEGAKLEDVLFAYQITGHFRYFADR